MNEALKQFSADLLKDFQAALLKNQDAVAKIKAAEDGGTFKVIISTSDEDRQGDSLDQTKWKLDNYKNNPVVLWAHDYYNPPIAICTGISIEGGKLVAEGKFAPTELNPFAAQIAGLYQAGYINTTSVGYIQHEDGELELLEFSFVPVPANPYALSLRDIKRLNLNTAELVMKGIRFVTKAPEIGDECELEDGTPGVLAEDENNPGKLVCVPAGGDKSKANEHNGDMNELTNNLKAERARHAEEIGKAIDGLQEYAIGDKEKTGKAMPEDDAYDKAIEEFKKAIDGEQETHLEKCMKAIDDNYELQDQKKSIDEFKSEIKAEHLEHVKCFDKAIDEFETKAEGAQNAEEHIKALEEFTKAAGEELDRHEKAQMEMCKADMGEGESDEAKATNKKGQVADEMAEDQERQQKYKKLDRAYEVFYAFTNAYIDDATPVDDFEKLLDEAVALMKDIETKAKGILATHMKSGRQISAKNKEKIQAIIKALEDHHTGHGKSVDEVTAALKEFISSGDGGEEPKPEKTGPAPNSRSRISGANDHKKSSSEELEAYLFGQRLVRQIKTVSENGLRQLNERLAKVYPRK